VEGGFDKISGYVGFQTLQKQSSLPEIIFAANDRVAQGAYKAISEAGLNIPDDIGVIALGHNEFAEILSPPLTIMDASPDVIGLKSHGNSSRRNERSFEAWTTSYRFRDINEDPQFHSYKIVHERGSDFYE
jgi:hypothetical protein